MTSKMGRPPKENPRDCSLTIRLTQEESMQITTVATMMGVSKTDAIVTAIGDLEKKVVKQKLKESRNKNMSKWNDTYIESKLDKYRKTLESEAEDLIINSVEIELEKEEQIEADRVYGELSGAAFDKHMDRFKEKKEKELYKYFKNLNEKDIEEELKRYRKELEESDEEY